MPVDETPELMPLPIAWPIPSLDALTKPGRSGELSWLRPDGKAQVTVRYEGGKPVASKSCYWPWLTTRKLALRQVAPSRYSKNH
jgi:S-adenosylmethionine synthetase